MAFVPRIFLNDKDHRNHQHQRRIIPPDRFNQLEAYNDDKFFFRYVTLAKKDTRVFKCLILSTLTVGVIYYCM